MVERRPTIGLALGSGGARGFAHLGVLRVLEEEEIPVDLLLGSSVGSLIGALWVGSPGPAEAGRIAGEVGRDDFFDFGPRAMFSGALARGEGIERFVRERIGEVAIESLPRRFGVVATELRTGRTVVFERGPLARAVRASCAIPGVFPPVEIDGELHVDGAVTAPVPAALVRARGIDLVIGVAIPAAIPDRRPESALQVVLRAIEILSTELELAKARDADILIVPEVGDVASDDFTQRERLIAAGEAAARAALPAIRAAIRERTRLVPDRSD